MLLGAGPALLADAAHAQGAMRFATPYPETNYVGRNNRQFVDDLRDASGGEVQAQLYPNASLLPLPQIKRGVQTGQIQIGEVLLNAYGNEDPFLEVDGIARLVHNWEEARRLARLSRPFIEARLQRQGMTMLYQIPWPPTGFFSNMPLNNVDALRGTRMRTYSASSNRFAALVGATPALVQIPEVPQAFATNVINLLITSAAAAVDLQVWDFAKIFTPVDFAFNCNGVFMSRRALDALSAAQQQAVREQAARAEARGWDWAAEATRTQSLALAQHGMEVSPPSPELLAGMSDVSQRLTEEWLTRAGADGRELLQQFRPA
jgi:TRAP-type C4-dicarboxylate transport system substrate-binding protein